MVTNDDAIDVIAEEVQGTEETTDSQSDSKYGPDYRKRTKVPFAKLRATRNKRNDIAKISRKNNR